MTIIPAIDLYNAQAVRLLKGSTRNLTVYSSEPEKVAARYEKDGAKLLHVVDLNGAKEGRLKNLPSLKKILKAVSIPVQFGGGIRTAGDVKMLFAAGVSRVVLGTKAYEDKNFLSRLPRKHISSIVIAADMKGKTLYVSGWDKRASVSGAAFIKNMQKQGVQTFLVTQILRDGTMKGPDFSGMSALLARFKCSFILSGGISSLEDIRKAASLNVDGVIVGKALYEKKFTLKQALRAARNCVR